MQGAGALRAPAPTKSILTYKTKLALDKEVGGGASPIEKPFHV